LRDRFVIGASRRVLERTCDVGCPFQTHWAWRAPKTEAADEGAEVIGCGVG